MNAKTGKMEHDGLVADLAPQTVVSGKTILGLAEETEFKRGTALAKNNDGKLVVLGTADATADCILCDDITVGTEDVNVVVYVAGCFNTNKITAKEGYAMTEEDIDNFRKVGIVLKAAQEI